MSEATLVFIGVAIGVLVPIVDRLIERMFGQDNYCTNCGRSYKDGGKK